MSRPRFSSWRGSREPDTVNGVTQIPMQGVSFAYSLNDADADERHHTQYFELMGNRGIYHRGWTAQTIHRIPWDVVSAPHPFAEDVWELYDTTADWTQAHDLSAEQPEKLADLQQLWLIEAVRHNVLPLDDRAAERMNPAIAGRPTLVQGDSLRLYPGMKRLGENVAINVKNRSYSVTAEIDDPRRATGRRRTGRAGRPHRRLGTSRRRRRLAYHYNYCGLLRATITAEAPLPAGTHQVRAEFAYAGGGIGRGGKVTLYVDGEATGSGEVKRTHPLYFSFDEGLDVGMDTAMPVFEDYSQPRGRFTGAINWAQIDLGDDDHNHLIPPEAHLQAAMTHQ